MFAIDLGLANIDDGTNGSVLVHIYYRAMAICMGVQIATHNKNCGFKHCPKNATTV